MADADASAADKSLTAVAKPFKGAGGAESSAVKRTGSAGVGTVEKADATDDQVE